MAEEKDNIYIRNNSTKTSDIELNMNNSTTPVDEESADEKPLVYGVSDRPPIHLILFFGFQVKLLYWCFRPSVRPPVCLFVWTSVRLYLCFLVNCIQVIHRGHKLEYLIPKSQNWNFLLDVNFKFKSDRFCSKKHKSCKILFHVHNVYICLLSLYLYLKSS